MARPDIQIGEETFKPKDMGFLKKAGINVLYGVALVLTDLQYGPPTLAKRIADTLELGAFYGHGAAGAFEDAIKPRVRSVNAIQRESQAMVFGHPNPHPRPVIDPHTREYGYRFVDTPPGSKTLILLTR